MLSFLVGVLANRGFGRVDSFYFNQGSQSAALPFDGRSYMHSPYGLGFGMMGLGSDPFSYYLSVVFVVVFHVLLVAILVAALRWIWKKGSQ